MVTTVIPDFMEWVEVTVDGWELKDDAPADVRKEFDIYMENLKMVEPIK